ERAASSTGGPPLRPRRWPVCPIIWAAKTAPPESAGGAGAGLAGGSAGSTGNVVGTRAREAEAARRSAARRSLARRSSRRWTAPTGRSSSVISTALGQLVDLAAHLVHLAAHLGQGIRRRALGLGLGSRARRARGHRVE